MGDNTRMQPVHLDQMLFEKRAKDVDPAFKEITAGLQEKLRELLRDPSAFGSCCIQGCCVSWCCVQLH